MGQLAQPMASTSPSKSRNDIFEPSPVVLTPPPPKPSAYPMVGTSTGSPVSMKSSRSRNSLFYETPTSSPVPAPVPRLPSSTRESGRSRVAPLDAFTDDQMLGSTDDQRSPYGRSSLEEQERERSRIRQNNSIDFRLSPSKDFLLGEGRHCNVFLGAYRHRDPECSYGQETDWQLCAIKRLHADRQSQLLGLDEAFTLRRIGHHDGIVRLVDIRDEVMAPFSPYAYEVTAYSGRQVVARQPQMSAVESYASSGQSLHHNRSTSDCLGKTPEAGMGQGFRRTQHARLASQPYGPVANVKADQAREHEGIAPSEAGALPHGASPAAHAASTQTGSSTASADPPRLLILMELLPSSLAEYARRNAVEVNMDFWLRCAIELASTIAFLHSRGCVHADIKPENILLDSQQRTKLCDFNSAIFPDAASSSMPPDGLGLGTPAYGAPELTQRRGRVSFPVDIFSLGAVLYGLATGVEPMSRARSAIDMLHRKERFFITEENDRMARISLGGGSSSSSAATSRRSSVRGKKNRTSMQSTSSNSSAHHRLSSDSWPAPSGGVATAGSNASTDSRPMLVHRQSSAESIRSVASGIASAGGRTPSVHAMQMLLEPGPVAGVLLPPAEQLAQGYAGNYSFVGGAGHQRAASLNKKPAPRTPVNDWLRPGGSEDSDEFGDGNASNGRPGWMLRRTTSHGGSRGSSAGGSKEKQAAKNGTADNTLLSPPLTPISSVDGNSVDIHTSLAASFADATRIGNASAMAAGRYPAASSEHSLAQQRPRALSGASSYSASYDDDDDYEDASMGIPGQEDLRPYNDGSPALILPGGDRLPQEAVDLLEEMVQPHPNKRPTARQVQDRLHAIASQYFEQLGW